MRINSTNKRSWASLFDKNGKSLFLIMVLVLSFTLLFLFFVSFLQFPLPQQENHLYPSDEHPSSDVFDEERWSMEIDRVGPREAYGKFKASYQSSPLIPKRHLAVHSFGELLYKKIGVEGLEVCDEVFQFGCFHGFLGHAIQEEGLGIIPRVKRICREHEKSDNCFHGIGHGILSFVGYEEKDLLQSLEFCRNLSLSFPKETSQCTGGVFMEYNFRTMLADGKPRSFDLTTPFAPCDSMPLEFRPSCYYWQSQWFVTVLYGDWEQKYEETGKLCEMVQNLEEQIQCFLGAGILAGQSADWDPSRATMLCQHMLERGELVCRAGAARAFFGESSLRSLAKMLCEGSTDTTVCFTLANIPQ